MKADMPECVWPLGAELGEGALWVPREAAVYFVDIKARRVNRFSPATGERRSWLAPRQPGFIAAVDDGAFLCGMQGGLYRFCADNGVFELLVEVEADRPGNRLNDGFVDAGGRLWFGSMDDAEQAPSGRLYRLTDEGAVDPCDDGYVITNGPAMSPDGRTLYHTDTLRRTIYAFDVSDTLALSRKRVFATIEGSGYPDGMAVDADGFVWVALFGGGRIERFSPQGVLAQTVAFPCENVTKLAFGGNDGRTVYATTACKGLSREARKRQPLAGGLFMFRSPVAGLPAASLAARRLECLLQR
ncbi:SMP-30/gluconolactonase/LRE family protein [Trinickia caryophylli]|uniref:Xylono-1,4-lactonase n=1 Tax=Trinickia caryophylli TaxID=28094 RepID=A0A1X7DEK3_TRICW|nr:SMP-30/gluconolactonase/LRE family protein [Trinickia caryophylli]PMS09810.1 SMP-30/gluconolactonase/LRE family protein [Trinickia caryophylli]TRX16878.1 SMP-30/gluconolactonase/LRE family protein [Trinickia caryophylli]WQE12392.1 SMP-30/gluconolactonase/LRE family protein [Trinickia caryophylli]SMF14181.1 Xylono-1,4-lactonase [Trinickia caryophylli]